jgi:hypothetical protein
MALPAWRLDATRFPLVVTYVVDGDGRSMPSLQSVTRALDKLNTLRGKKVIVVDLSESRPDAARRRLFVDWTKTHWASLRDDLLGVSCVVPSDFQRATLTGILWFVEPTCPIETFETRDAALAWAVQRLQELGLHVPAPSQ